MKAVAVIGLGVVCTVALAVPRTRVGSPEVGCPGASKWEHVTLQEAAQRIFDEANNNGFTSVQEVYAVLDGKYDKNGNDQCALTRCPSRSANPTPT